MSRVILITGPPGSGKSTLVREISEGLNLRVGGIVTPEIRKGRVRTGFKIIDLKSREQETLASTDIRGPKIGKYGVNVKGVDRIVDRFLETLPDIDVCIIDELGPMELFSEKFKEMVDIVLASRKTALIVVHRSLASEYKKHGKLFTLTRENREKIRKAVLDLVIG